MTEVNTIGSPVLQQSDFKVPPVDIPIIDYQDDITKDIIIKHGELSEGRNLNSQANCSSDFSPVEITKPKILDSSLN